MRKLRNTFYRIANMLKKSIQVGVLNKLIHTIINKYSNKCIKHTYYIIRSFIANIICKLKL